MFYFFFESRSNPKDDPVVLWMTGVLSRSHATSQCLRPCIRIVRAHTLTLVDFVPPPCAVSMRSASSMYASAIRTEAA